MSGFAQQREIISSAGSDTIVGEEYYSFTIGETVIEATNMNGFWVASGFEQSDLYASINVSTDEILMEAKIYPNPSIDYFFLEITGTSSASFKAVLHNSKGYFVQQKTFSDTKVKFETTGLAPGVYYLTVIDDNDNRMNQFKVVKFK